MQIIKALVKKKYFLYVLSFLLVIILEVFLFNNAFFSSVGYKENPVSYSKLDDGSVIEEGPLDFYDASLQLYFTNQTPLHTVALDFAPVESFVLEQTLPSGQLLGTNEERIVTVSLYGVNGETPEEIISKVCVLTKNSAAIIRLSKAVQYSAYIVYIDNPYEMDVSLKGITVNARIPFQFSFIRCVILLGISLLFIAYRPASKLWKTKLADMRKTSTAGVMIITFTLVFSVFMLFFFLNPIASAKIPAVDSYGKLSVAIANGSFSLLEKPDESLLNLASPYEPALRNYQDIKFLWDFALYDGKYYVYFGIIPCLLFFLPFYLVTGKCISYAFVFSVFVGLFLVSLELCLKSFIKRYAKDASLGAFLLLYLLSAFGSGYFYVIQHTTTYGIPQVSALAFALLGIFFYFKAEEGERVRKRYLILGSFSMAFVAGCRPHLVLAALLAYPILKNKMCKKKTLALWLSFFLPFVVVAIPLMLYNYVRFGAFFDFGSQYNLTLHKVYGYHYNFDDLWKAFLYYLCVVPKLSGEFPYLTRQYPEYLYKTDLYTTTDGGFFWFVPLVLLAFLFWPGKKKEEREKKVFQAIALILGIVILLIDSQAFMMRYAFDFLGFLILATWNPLLYLLNLNRGKSGKLGCGVIVFLVMYTIIVSMLSYFSLVNGGGLKVQAPEVFYRIEEYIRFWR